MEGGEAGDEGEEGGKTGKEGRRKGEWESIRAKFVTAEGARKKRYERGLGVSFIIPAKLPALHNISKGCVARGRIGSTPTSRC